MEFANRRRQRETPKSRLCFVLPSSRPPCEKISIVRSGLDTPQQLLQFGLRFGSQMCLFR